MVRRTRVGIGCAAGLAAALCSRGAFAQAPQRGCARLAADIEVAVREREFGRVEAALEVLTDLATRCPHPRVTAQMALAEIDLHRWTDAWRHLEESLADGTDPWIRSRRAALLVARSELRAHMATLVLQSSITDGVVWVDGRPASAAGVRETVVVAPGVRVVEVRTANGPVERREVTLAEGARAEVTFEAPPPAPVVAPTPAAVRTVTRPPVIAPARASSSSTRTAAWVLEGIGAASLVVGGVQLVRSVLQAGALSDATAATPGGEGAFVRYVTNPSYPAMDRSTDTACALAARQSSSMADAAATDALCSANATTRITAWVFGATGLALTAVGAVLLAANPRATSAAPSVAVLPQWGSAPGAVIVGVF